jgi:excinuclease ABC subunit A
MLPIRLRVARTHNLRDIDLELLPGQLVAVTGPSGAGKSSLALDTLYAEGQRRFVESFSPYARQFLERLERPPMEELAPVAATVAVDRRAPVKSSRSTLATMADLESYLAALFAREAIPTCPACGVQAMETSPRDAAAKLTESFAGMRALVTYPVIVDDAEQFLDLREALATDGYRKLVIGDRVCEIDDVRPSEATAPGVRVEVLVDRVAVSPRERRRLEEAIETAWSRGGGRAEARAEVGHVRDQPAARSTPEKPATHVTVQRGLACPQCARGFDPPRPGLFSYNSPFGACEPCRGFGRVISIDWDKVMPDPRKSLGAGAVKPWSGPSTTWERRTLEKFCAARKIPLDVPWGKLKSDHRE